MQLCRNHTVTLSLNLNSEYATTVCACTQDVICPCCVEGKIREPSCSKKKGASFLGGSGGVPPRKFWNLDAWKCYFHRFPDSIWALRTIKINYVYFKRSFPQNLNHWLLEKSEGSLGAYPPENFEILDAWKCYFHCFPDSIWALKQSKLRLY